MLSEQTDDRHSPLANHEPIPQRSHQQRQRQQIHSLTHLHPDKILLSRRLSLLLCSPRPQCHRPPPTLTFPHNKDGTSSARPFCRRCFRRSAQRIFDARRGNQKRDRRVCCPNRGGKSSE